MLGRKRIRASASNYAGLGLPKGRPRADIKREARQHEVDVIRTVRALVWERDASCRACAGARGAWLPDQMHELVPRSATRKMAPERRFSLTNCCRLCALCHRDVTEKRLLIAFDPRDGANGFLFITDGESDE